VISGELRTSKSSCGRRFVHGRVHGDGFPGSVPGAGISFGSVGRLLLLFDADDNLLSVEQDVDNVQSDFAALCKAL
jgi:hypothetical protein